MNRRRSIAEWEVRVFRTTAVPDSVRVLLLYLAKHARPDRYSGLIVSVPRRKIAADLGRSERNVDKRFKQAREAGFLTSIRRGFEGQTAEYGLTFPGAESLSVTDTLSRSKSLSVKDALSVTETDRLSPHESLIDGGRAIDRHRPTYADSTNDTTGTAQHGFLSRNEESEAS